MQVDNGSEFERTGFVRVDGHFDRAEDAWRAAEDVVTAASAPNTPVEVIGDFVVPPVSGSASRDFQTLHLDFGLPLNPAVPRDVARFTALHVVADEPASEAATRLVPPRALLAARRWPDREELLRRFAASPLMVPVTVLGTILPGTSRAASRGLSRRCSTNHRFRRASRRSRISCAVQSSPVSPTSCCSSPLVACNPMPSPWRSAWPPGNCSSWTTSRSHTAGEDVAAPASFTNGSLGIEPPQLSSSANSAIVHLPPSYDDPRAAARRPPLLTAFLMSTTLSADRHQGHRPTRRCPAPSHDRR